MDLNTRGNGQLNVKKDNILYKFFRFLSIKEKTGIIPQRNEGEAEEILEDIRDARKEWINTCINLEFADDEEIIDYYIYKLKACEVRYEYFIKKAKERRVKAEVLENADFAINKNRYE